jgi:hypothetical protein
MDSDVKKALDLRLARGEISEADYLRLQSRLADSTVAKPLHGIEERPLLSLDNELLIFSDHLVVAGRRKNYADVISVSGGGSTFTLNAMPVTKQSSITIKFIDGSSYYQDEDRTVFGSSRHKIIRSAVASLRKATFSHRYVHAASRLEKIGQMEIGFQLLGGLIVPKIHPVMLTKEGVILGKDISLELRRCRREGVLELGIERANTTDPSAVYASYAKSLMELGRRQALKFNVVEDTDVSLGLIRSLAGQ